MWAPCFILWNDRRPSAAEMNSTLVVLVLSILIHSKNKLEHSQLDPRLAYAAGTGHLERTAWCRTMYPRQEILSTVENSYDS
jgi:hypothetical protein